MPNSGMTTSFPVRLLSRLVGRQGEAHSSKNDEMRASDWTLMACPPDPVTIVSAKCKFCGTRPATMHFGGTLSFTHGGGKNCCELCCAEKQLAHAKERAAVIPELEARIAELRGGDAS